MKKVNQHILWELWKHRNVIFTKYKGDLKTRSQHYFNGTATEL